MKYFRYSFLNILRDELSLTLTRQRITLFHLFSGLFLVVGLAVGVLWGHQAGSWLYSILAGIAGLMLGAVVAWVLPRLLFVVFWLFESQRWFLRPEPPSTTPVSPVEFHKRSEAFEVDERRQSVLWISCLAGGAIVTWLVGIRANGERPFAGVVGVFFLGFITTMILLRRCSQQRLAEKHAMNCPNCGKLITDAAGMCRMPYMGLCRHCGAKIVEMNEVN